jgi:response regulator RpfG family c-di-GMP phosphodiesterase
MLERILFVDDDPIALEDYCREFRRDYEVLTAESGEAGHAALAADESITVILANMHLAGMNASEFFARAKELRPDATRLLLAGIADRQAAMAAVSEGNIFQVLTKPCPPGALAKALAAAVRQHRLLRAERELLEKTLRGSVHVLTEVLSVVSPIAFGRASRVQRLSKSVAREMGLADDWQLDVAALLSQLGCISVPDTILARVYRGDLLSIEERRIFDHHPAIASGLLKEIPQLQRVAEIVAYQERHFDGSGPPSNGRRGSEIPIEARILKAVLDFDSLESRNHAADEALDGLSGRSGWYDPDVVDALERVVRGEAACGIKSLQACDLRAGMQLAEDLTGPNGLLLMRKGQQITENSVTRLQNLAWKGALAEAFKILTTSAGRLDQAAR